MITTFSERYTKITAVFVLSLLLFCICSYARAKAPFPGIDTAVTNKLDSVMPVRGFSIGVPKPAGVADFVNFIKDELAPRNINTLILRVDYNYQYKTHPELIDSNALSKKDIKKIVKVCRENNIRIVCQINMLGHQSWASKANKLLSVYPQFDETPLVLFPAKYEWPNADYLYCKSYCPLHPDVHKVLFDLVDELCDVFETKDFHAGMDEVFYLGEDQCPRCRGKSKAALYAGEVALINDHLKQHGRKLWIWGDRLLDANTTGLGIWESSISDTWRAIDIIPKDVMICDWHYDRPDPTAVYFAMKGFDVATCSWRNPQATETQVNDMARYRRTTAAAMKNRFKGMIYTVWTRNDAFLQEMHNGKDDKDSQSYTFKTMFSKINQL